MVGRDVGIDPFGTSDRLPAQGVAGVDTNDLEHQPLRTSVAISEWVDDVELTVVVSQTGHELVSSAREGDVLVFVIRKKA